MKIYWKRFLEKKNNTGEGGMYANPVIQVIPVLG